MIRTFAARAKRGVRCMTTHATESATASFLGKSAKDSSVIMPRTGLSVSRLVFGGDNLGDVVSVRGHAMLSALSSGTVNTVQVGLSEMSARRMEGSLHYTRDTGSQIWEVRL